MNNNAKLDQLSILIVEDNEQLAELLEDVFQTMGIKTIHKATNGTSGYELYCKTKPDIVFTDWHMPDLNGIELTKKIRTDDSSPDKFAPIVMMTGYNVEEKIKQCRDAGATEYILKPFIAEDVIKRIAHITKSPRKFIETKTFFGPDRRRKQKQDFKGKFKRKEDFATQEKST